VDAVPPPVVFDPVVGCPVPAVGLPVGPPVALALGPSGVVGEADGGVVSGGGEMNEGNSLSVGVTWSGLRSSSCCTTHTTAHTRAAAAIRPTTVPATT
jgi:hypothetical protein